MDMKELQITEIIRRTPKVTSFRLARGDFGDFLPGQFIQVFLRDDLYRYLSISSSPSKDYIEFTKKITGSDFCRALEKLKPGDRVKIKGPSGRFIYDPECRKVSFLIGGIGITPVISILEYIDENKPDISVHLLYSNRGVDEIAFKPQLDRIARENPSVDITYIITDEDADKDKYLCSLMNEEVIKKYIPESGENTFFLCGPPGMVECIKALLLNAGYDAGRIRTENFIGY